MLRRSLIALSILLVALAAVVAAGVLASLDWSRRRSVETAALPELSPEMDTGLVRIRANGLEFRARVAGLGNAGSALILLHGFPETSAMWQPLIEAAEARGHRVIAFDQRGYSPGARPAEVSAYTLDRPASDVLAIADAAGFEQFHLVGHDWGCSVGWIVSLQNPGRVLSWTGMSIPHVGALVDELRGELPSYIKLFNLPWLAEGLFSFGGFALLRRGLPEDEALRAEMVAALSEPGALSAALNWYRAIPAGLGSLVGDSFEISTPTLFIWGEREGWVTPQRLERQRALMRGPYQELEVDAGHWVVEHQTRTVVERVIAHLKAVDLSRAATSRAAGERGR